MTEASAGSVARPDAGRVGGSIRVQVAPPSLVRCSAALSHPVARTVKTPGAEACGAIAETWMLATGAGRLAQWRPASMLLKIPPPAVPTYTTPAPDGSV